MASKRLLNSVSRTVGGLAKYKMEQKAELKATRRKLNELMPYIWDQDLYLKMFKLNLEEESDMFAESQRQDRAVFEDGQQESLDRYLEWQTGIEYQCRDLETRLKKLEKNMKKIDRLE